MKRLDTHMAPASSRWAMASRGTRGTGILPVSVARVSCPCPHGLEAHGTNTAWKAVPHRRRNHWWGAVLGVVVALALGQARAAAEPLGTAFSYEGRLLLGGAAVEDTCDLVFSLWDDPVLSAPENQVGPAVALIGPDAVAVSGGLLAVELDFGPGAFTGRKRWLQIAVACPSGGDLTPLSPRQPIRPTPESLHAQAAATLAAGAEIVGDESLGTILTVTDGTDLGESLGLAATGGAEGLARDDSSDQKGINVFVGERTGLFVQNKSLFGYTSYLSNGSTGPVIGAERFISSTAPVVSFVGQHDGTAGLLEVSNFSDGYTLRVRGGSGMHVERHYFDSTTSPGDPGQILSATETGTKWIDKKSFPDGILVPEDEEWKFRVLPGGDAMIRGGGSLTVTDETESGRPGGPSILDNEPTDIRIRGATVVPHAVAIQGEAHGANGRGVLGIALADDGTGVLAEKFGNDNGVGLHALGGRNAIEAQSANAENPTIKARNTAGPVIDFQAPENRIGEMVGNTGDIALSIHNVGAGHTVSVTGGDGLHVQRHYFDSNNSPGTPGQLLSATETGTAWKDCDCEGGGGGGIGDGTHVFTGNINQTNTHPSTHGFVYNYPNTSGNAQGFRINNQGTGSSISIEQTYPGTTGGSAVSVFTMGGSVNTAAFSGTQGGPGPVYDASVSGGGTGYRAFIFQTGSIGFDATASGAGTAARLSASGNDSLGLQITANKAIQASGTVRVQGAAATEPLVKYTNQFGDMPVLETDGNVKANGDICATGSIGACSDSRFKRSVRPLEGALGTVSKLRSVRFAWDRDQFPDHRFPDREQVGFIAQEIREVLPEVVTQDAAGYYAVDYSRLTPLLVDAIQEQQRQLAERDAELARVREQLAAFERAQTTAADQAAALVRRLEQIEQITSHLTR